ncbi:MAG: hypothetical protein MZU91_06605 [Desulfosudis oleivorans]|nr:hypothetical protein [Desulfosudis oleivorans]
MEASFAIADAVRLADTDVVAAYPITPADAHCRSGFQRWWPTVRLDAELHLRGVGAFGDERLRGLGCGGRAHVYLPPRARGLS